MIHYICLSRLLGDRDLLCDPTSLMDLQRVVSFSLFSIFSCCVLNRKDGIHLQTPHRQNWNRKSDVQCPVVPMFVSYASSLRFHVIPFKSITCIMKPQFQIHLAGWLLCLQTTEKFWRKLQDLMYLTLPQHFLLLYLSLQITWHFKVEIFLSSFCQGKLLNLLPKNISSLSI